jgi:hypothetical protein
MSSGVRDLGENAEFYGESLAHRECGACRNGERAGSEGGEVRGVGEGPWGSFRVIGRGNWAEIVKIYLEPKTKQEPKTSQNRPQKRENAAANGEILEPRTHQEELSGRPGRIQHMLGALVRGAKEMWRARKFARKAQVRRERRRANQSSAAGYEQLKFLVGTTDILARAEEGTQPITEDWVPPDTDEVKGHPVENETGTACRVLSMGITGTEKAHGPTGLNPERKAGAKRIWG